MNRSGLLTNFLDLAGGLANFGGGSFGWLASTMSRPGIGKAVKARTQPGIDKLPQGDLRDSLQKRSDDLVASADAMVRERGKTSDGLPGSCTLADSLLRYRRQRSWIQDCGHNRILDLSDWRNLWCCKSERIAAQSLSFQATRDLGLSLRLLAGPL